MINRAKRFMITYQLNSHDAQTADTYLQIIMVLFNWSRNEKFESIEIKSNTLIMTTFISEISKCIYQVTRSR
jgi:hypothetical protein